MQHCSSLYCQQQPPVPLPQGEGQLQVGGLKLASQLHPGPMGETWEDHDRPRDSQLTKPCHLKEAGPLFSYPTWPPPWARIVKILWVSSLKVRARCGPHCEPRLGMGVREAADKDSLLGQTSAPERFSQAHLCTSL